MTKSVIGRLLLPLLLSGCAKSGHYGPTHIDGSTVSSYTSSVIQIREELSDRDYQEFKLALVTVQMAQRDRGVWSDTPSISPQVLAAVDGRTAYDIVNMASTMRGAVPVR